MILDGALPLSNAMATAFLLQLEKVAKRPDEAERGWGEALLCNCESNIFEIHRLNFFLQIIFLEN